MDPTYRSTCFLSFFAAPFEISLSAGDLHACQPVDQDNRNHSSPAFEICSTIVFIVFADSSSTCVNHKPSTKDVDLIWCPKSGLADMKSETQECHGF